MKLNLIDIKKLTGMKGIFSLLAAGMVMMSSCTTDPNSPGVEFMPDMYRSPSYEVYSQKMDYSDLDTNTEDASLNAKNKALMAVFNHNTTTRLPAENSIPQGFMPYAYPNTPEGYNAAGLELKNPILLTPTVLEEGKEMFEIFCDHCHGEKGDGKGSIGENGNWPAPVPTYLAGALATLEAGKMFHTTQYGKNMMGSHASQLSADERWKIIHYIFKLQGRNTSEVDSTETEN